MSPRSHDRISILSTLGFGAAMGTAVGGVERLPASFFLQQKLDITFLSGFGQNGANVPFVIGSGNQADMGCGDTAVAV